jgi:vacuolar protein sorting-associated protein VTA1
MAAHIPQKLKAADLTRFATRAAQLETVKPVVAYWCEYWIVNQILAKGLHNGDDETLQYTTTLMDKLEQIKAENSTNDAITDDMAGQAYCEQFGRETFDRADRAVHANKVTRQTADTFLASVTFLELVNIWSSPDAETLKKIKYAKWNATRILKALKEGKDPNESNPKPEPGPEENLPALDPHDPEVQQFGTHPVKPQPAYVEEVPDEQDKVELRLARQSSIDQSLHPSAQVSATGSPRVGPAPAFDPYPRDGFPYSAVEKDGVSPMEKSPDQRVGSVGGGYFPEIPTMTSEPRDATLATAPPDDPMDLGLPQQPSSAPGQVSPGFGSFPPLHILSEPSAPPQDFYRQSPPSQPTLSTPVNYSAPPVQPPQPSYQAPHFQSQQPVYQAPPVQPTYQAPPQQFHAPPPQPYSPAPPKHQTNQQLNTDDVAIAKAQKHAKWAISALNFEDAETAVRELRAALQTLGAQ